MASYDDIRITDQPSVGKLSSLSEGSRRKFPVGVASADDENIPSSYDAQSAATRAGVRRGDQENDRCISFVLDMDFDS